MRVGKFVDGRRETSFSLPVVVLRIANAVLPGAALEPLATRGLNVRQVMEAKRNGSSYTAKMDVRERGMGNEVVVSLE
jgi:hypothetical protein